MAPPPLLHVHEWGLQKKVKKSVAEDDDDYCIDRLVSDAGRTCGTISPLYLSHVTRSARALIFLNVLGKGEERKEEQVRPFCRAPPSVCADRPEGGAFPRADTENARSCGRGAARSRI